MRITCSSLPEDRDRERPLSSRLLLWRVSGTRRKQAAQSFRIRSPSAVARFHGSTDDTFARCIAALKRTGKDAIVLNRPVEGFLFNRLQHALLPQAYYLIETLRSASCRTKVC